MGDLCIASLYFLKFPAVFEQAGAGEIVAGILVKESIIFSPVLMLGNRPKELEWSAQVPASRNCFLWCCLVHPGTIFLFSSLHYCNNLAKLKYTDLLLLANIILNP